MLSHEFGEGFHHGQQSLGRAGTGPSIEVPGGVPIALKTKATISPHSLFLWVLENLPCDTYIGP